MINQKNFLKSKRADISILLLVVMTVVLCSASLFIFYLSEEGLKKDVTESSIIPQFYAENELFKINAYYLAKITVSELEKESEQKAETSRFSSVQFIERFKDNYKKYIINNKDFPEEYGQYYKLQIMNGSYDVQIAGDKLNFKFNNFEFSKINQVGGESTLSKIGRMESNESIVFEIPLKTLKT
jgi:hypothetical protein